MEIMLNRMALHVVRNLEPGDKRKILLRCLPHKPMLILPEKKKINPIFLFYGAYIMKCHKIQVNNHWKK